MRGDYMPMGDNPNSRKNLERGKATQFQRAEDAVRRGRNGNIAREAKRQRTKTMREAVKALLDVNCTDEKRAEILLSIGLEPSNRNAATFAMLEKALNGSEKAYEVLRDTAGEMPKLQVGVTSGDAITPEDLRNMSDAELSALVGGADDAGPDDMPVGG